MRKKIGEWQVEKRTGCRFRWKYDNHGFLVKEYEPGPWKTDNQGRRYRMVAGVKEYETITRTSKGFFTDNELKNMNHRKEK